MPDFDTAHAAISALIADFEAHHDKYMDPGYSEAQARLDFIDKFWTALGWDVKHEKQKNPYEQEVRVERTIAVGGAQKRADYAFFLAPNFSQPHFFVEAKKPFAQLDALDNCFQLVRYAWNAGCPLSVLHDFEELIILDCRWRPDKATAQSRIWQKFHFIDFKDPEKLRFLYHLFSREAAGEGAIAKRAAELPKPRGKSVQRELFKLQSLTLDEAFLAELEEWRADLAKGFKRDNEELDSETLTEITQRTLDRLVFLRFLEDKGIEQRTTVGKLGAGSGSSWADFRAASRRLDGIYNGAIFRRHPILDDDGFAMGDDVFGGICEKLDAANSPYDFNVIPIHILGSIYERFLGSVIIATDKRAKVEQKPEVRKAGGVYYTPEYIVRYIVQQTVGRQIEGKTPDQIESMSFADIACGSGSFLLGVFDCLLRYHTKWFNEHPERAQLPKPVKLTKKGAPHKQRREVAGDCFKDHDTGSLRLTLEKKRQILLNNVFGTDIAGLFQLPPEEEEKLRPMDFETTFPEVFQRGGFDAIVGNPPYVRQESLKETKPYFEKKYEAFAGTADLYSYFMEAGVKRLRSSGRYSIIVSSSFMRANYGEPLRATLKQHAAVERIVDFGGLAVFADAKDTYVCIPILSRSPQPARVEVCKVQILDAEQVDTEMSKVDFTIPHERLSREGWVLRSEEEVAALNKIRGMGKPLGEYVAGRFFRGVTTGLNEAFVINEAQMHALIAEHPSSAELIHPARGGEDVRTYYIKSKDCYLIFPRRGTDINKYPAIKRHLEEFRKELTPRNSASATKGRKPGAYEWFEIQDDVAYYAVFHGPKIVFPDICKYPRFCLDDSGIYLMNTAYALGTGDKYLLGILNSRLFWFCISMISIPFGVRAGEFRYRLIYQYMEQIPIRVIDPKNAADTALQQRMNEMVTQILEAKQQEAAAVNEAKRDFWTRKAAGLDRQIDALVYELYDLTPEEIALVEGGGDEKVGGDAAPPYQVAAKDGGEAGDE